jgi:hypothetical protein
LLCGIVPAQGFAGSAVEFGGDEVEVLGAVLGEVAALGEVLGNSPLDAPMFVKQRR